jgi:uncharacterized damage-inducible protein DinB
MKKFSLVAAILLVAGMMALSVLAQDAAKKEAPKPVPGPAADAIVQWNEIGRKLIAMAEDFPEDKYDYKPTPEVRSFAQQILHLAGTNMEFSAAANGGKPSGEEELSRAQYKTKADVVAVLKKSFADGAAIMQQKGDKGIMTAIKNPYSNEMTTLYSLALGFNEHSGEHYGQLVVYYRLNGMVPPESRPKK